MGRFQLADKGTLFLDEIAAVPINLQSKLLRVLESGEFEPIGSSRTCHVNVRILSATNADIEKEVAAGGFRQDLLYRLNTVLIHVPPLRKRPEDIPLLATHFLQEYVTKYRKAISGFSDAALEALLDYPWPGNVRQLDHAIERAALMTQASFLGPADLGLHSGEPPSPQFENMTLDQIEHWAVRKAFDRYDGDISKAAQALGLSRAALYRRLEKYQID
jgi:DNA-binding NtrC family response regulator